jgi:hypothetical protein
VGDHHSMQRFSFKTNKSWAHFGGTYPTIGTIQSHLAWFLSKGDTQISGVPLSGAIPLIWEVHNPLVVQQLLVNCCFLLPALCTEVDPFPSPHNKALLVINVEPSFV